MDVQLSSQEMTRKKFRETKWGLLRVTQRHKRELVIAARGLSQLFCIDTRFWIFSRSTDGSSTNMDTETGPT